MQDFTLNLLAELSAKPNNTIDSGDYKTYKACDRCRSRKRGCDGLFPCTNCKWAKVEGECHYSVIKQVERVNASKRTCDQCRQKKRKCSGDEPCDVCLKSKSRNENGDPICTYTRKRKREEQDTLTPQPTPPPPQEYINDGYLEGYISNEIVNLMEPPSGVGFEPFQPQLEQHLFQLVSIVLQAIPLKGQDKRDIVSPSGVPPTMNSCLKNALFASACMFSTHPLLHLHGSSLKQRIDTARGYASRAIQHLNFALMNQHFAPIPDTFSRPNDPLLHMPYETFENTDMIRAMLSLAHVSYGIGEGEEACYIGDLLGVFAFKTGPRPKPMWSVDSLVFRTTVDLPSMVPHNAAEEQERFLLWASCLVFDTYCSMESGHGFALNEQLYPDFCAGWRPRSFDKQIQPPGRNPTKAMNTIWENGPYAQMFDRVSDFCTYDLYPHATSSTFNYVVWICVILRRILRVVRSRTPLVSSEGDDIWWKETLFVHPCSIKHAFMPIDRATTPETLHDSLILWYANLPDRARAFSSLEVFGTPHANPESDDLYWSYAAPAIEGTLLFLSSFCYLHMGSLDHPESSNLFRLSSTRYGDFSSLSQTMERYSSRQVLLACLRALGFMLRRLLAHEQPLLPSDIPSPVQYWAIQPLELFIIASAGLLATRVSPFKEQEYNEALGIVNLFVLPTLQKYCKVWPMGIHYKTKLETLLTNVQV